MSTASHEGGGLQLQSAASPPDREAASPGSFPDPACTVPPGHLCWYRPQCTAPPSPGPEPIPDPYSKDLPKHLAHPDDFLLHLFLDQGWPPLLLLKRLNSVVTSRLNGP